MDDQIKRKRSFKVHYYNETTREVELTATMKTVPVTKKRLHELIQIEIKKATKPCCWEVSR